MSEPSADRHVPGKPFCPDCGTDLVQTPRRSRPRPHPLWCWRCERYMRAGEAREARRLADIEAGAEIGAEITDDAKLDAALRGRPKTQRYDG